VAYAQARHESLFIETVEFPDCLTISEAEIELIEVHLRDILIAMLQAEQD